MEGPRVSPGLPLPRKWGDYGCLNADASRTGRVSCSASRTLTD